MEDNDIKIQKLQRDFYETINYKFFLSIILVAVETGLKIYINYKKDLLVLVTAYSMIIICNLAREIFKFTER